MATGISKREQLSQDALSVLDIYEDSVPLPAGDAEVVLSYPNKSCVEDIIKPTSRQFVNLKAGKEVVTGGIPFNSFVLDDNFFVLNELVRQNVKVNLFYLDPPYGTGLDFQSRDLEHAYKDSMGQATYLEFMRRRLILMREVMADDGSIYIHIGHQMLAHFKVLMDEIFGAKNFRNIITRRKCSSKNFTSKQYANVNDYVLFYTKGKSYKWNRPGIAPEQEWIKKEYPKVDDLGRRYKLVPIHAPGVRHGETGKSWRGMEPPPGKHWQYAPSKLDELDRLGDIYWSKNGNPRRKVYWSSDKKMALTDYWDKYRDAHHQSIRITGYPTEKNFEMLKMIVGASSEENDLVMDPFCGSGTSIHAARDLGRRYIGVDASFSAAKSTLRRMRYGVEKMGDYVNKKPPGPPSLFDNEIGSVCDFVVDKELLMAYGEAIRDIAEI